VDVNNNQFIRGHFASRTRRGKAYLKHQAPSSNIQKSSKFQHPIMRSGKPERRLNIGAWNFSGAWMLVLGGSFRV
jgi:hypothetical protein